MASSLIETRRGSLGGVPLYVRKVKTEEGVNRVKYLFLNSSRRTQKPLGKFPPIFTVDCFTYSQDGSEYKQNKDRLRKVLSSNDGSIFVHPWDGNAFVTCKGKYTFTEDFSEGNKCIFSITLEVVDSDSPVPQVVTDQYITPSGLAAQSLDANRSLQNASASLFISTSPDNIDVSKSLFDSVSGSLNSTFSGIGDSIAQISDYTEDALDIAQQAQFYADNPLIGFAAISDSILGIDGLTTDVYAKFRACQALFNWGDPGTDYDVNATSPSRINPSPLTYDDAERLRNSDTMKAYMKTAGCLEAYTQSAAIPYQNSDEIDAVIDIMESQFDELIGVLTSDVSLPVNIPDVDYSEVYSELSKTRIQSLLYLAQQKTQTARLEMITVDGIPASVLSYRLYGTGTRAEEILEINKIRDNMDLRGEIWVYSK